MATSAQILTNRENAQHSTGPRTAEGKRASSLNSTRHGLTSQLVLLPGEDAAPYNAFSVKLLTELAPEGTLEQMLAQTICETQWRIERARKNEANILALPHFEELPAALDAIEDPARRNAMIEAYACTKYEKALRNLHIQEGRLQRGLVKTLADFRSLQQDRDVTQHNKMTEAINARDYHTAIERPFHPADLGFVFTKDQIEREIETRHIQTDPQNTHGVPQIETRTERLARFARSRERIVHSFRGPQHELDKALEVLAAA